MRYPHTATIQRMSEVSGKYVYSDVGTTVCFKQPIDDTSAQLFGITFTKGSVAYLPVDADVEAKDNLVIDGVTYGVRGVSVRDYGTLNHRKAILEQV